MYCGTTRLSHLFATLTTTAAARRTTIKLTGFPSATMSEAGGSQIRLKGFLKLILALNLPTSGVLRSRLFLNT